MKKDKKQIRGALMEALAEIALTLIFFGIGALVIGLFGVKLDSPNIDGDFVILIGIVVLCAIVAIVCAILQWIKKLIDRAHRKGDTNMHHMKLHPAPFGMIASGQKTIELGYEIGEVTPVDLFPRTGHVESVVCLKRS